MRKKTISSKVSPYLFDEEVEHILTEIGGNIKKLMVNTTIDKFAYETSITRSLLSKYRNGGDMLLSTFLRIVYGLGTSPEKFFKQVARGKKR